MLRRALVALLGLQVVAAAAAPFVPHHDAQIVARLPAGANPVSRELRELRRQLTGAPANDALAETLARRYVEVGRSTQDQRYYGYAQAVLRRWWDEPRPPVAVLLLRALIRQAQHDYGAALRDLEQAVDRDPLNPQVWLTRATNLHIQGHYAQALRSCTPLQSLGKPLLAVLCRGASRTLLGEPEAAYQDIRAALGRQPERPAAEVAWTEHMLADLATAAGNGRAADAHFQRALADEADNVALLAAYADFLLDQGRAARVRALLRDRIADTTLLLRLALAERQLGGTELPGHLLTLRARFAAAAERGPNPHLRDEIRFRLELEGDAETALALAQRNWAKQKEAWDARLLVMAARGAGRDDLAAPVRRWMTQHNWRHPWVRQALAQSAGRAP